jgi:hypothetical protein
MRLTESESKKVTLRTMVAWYLPFNIGRLIDPIVCRLFNVKKDKALMETAVVKFLNVSSLTIYGDPGRSSQPQPDPILMNAYTACASNLRTLKLISCSGDFHTILPLNASVLTSLEEVTLFINELRNDFSTDAEAFWTFFQAIASTLTTLNILFNDTPDETSRLLKYFPRQGAGAPFPKFTSFSIDHLRLPASPNSNLMEFLNQHADTLKHLSLQHIPLGSQSLGVPDPLPLPILPHLETLEFKYTDIGEVTSSEGLDAVRAFSQHSGSTLTSLSMAHCSFTLHDLSMLLDVLGQASLENTGGGGLKRLTVAVQVLSPQLLDMLAEQLPKLERLKISFTHLRSNNGSDVSMSTGEGSSRAGTELTHEVQFCLFFFFCRPILMFSFSLLEHQTISP